MKRNTSNIFEVSESHQNVICPPDQVFKNSDFEFLFTIGGHLVDDSSEYQFFMKLLKDMGEDGFTIKENFGATITERTKPFEATFSVDSTLGEFDSKIKEFDEHFGLTPWHWFVHGQKANWGIYISEYPTVNIIGCEPGISTKFKNAFKIIDNGYNQIQPFLEKEFEIANESDLKDKFTSNYKIKTTPQHDV